MVIIMKFNNFISVLLKMFGYEKKEKSKKWFWPVVITVTGLAGVFTALHFIGKANKDRDRIEFGDDKIEDAAKKKTYDKVTVYEKSIKPIVDKLMAFMGLVLLSPLFAIISLAIVIDDPGPVLFSQKRVGKDKKFFKLYKFRSMKMSTPHDTPTHLLSDPDQYITRVGKFLRKTSLDELPQLYNIFVGDMAVVGPRPALWNQDDLVAERDLYAANDVIPGLTGWAQINGRDELEIPVKAKLDGDYVEALKKSSMSGILMDIRCFFNTISSVIRSDGVVEGGTGEINERNHLNISNLNS